MAQPHRLPRLAGQELALATGRLPQWTVSDERGGTLTRTFKFADFAQAFAFMTRVAAAAEALDHHPEWSNVYNRVTVTWTTHDAGGVTARDLQMAEACDRIAAELKED